MRACNRSGGCSSGKCSPCRIIWIGAAAIVLFYIITGLSGCGAPDAEGASGYTQITAEEAKQIIDGDGDYIILDVRTEEEYAEGHIPNALLIPDYEIQEKAGELLTDKGQTILVYCRSGNRSKVASEKLAEMGYTDVREFGGINDWPYEVE